MVYLSHFEFPDREIEYNFTMNQKRTCYDTFYPFLVLSEHRLRELDFEPVTILYGGNGSGKTTALNVIAETLGLERDTLYNRSNFFEEYTRLCSCVGSGESRGKKRIPRMPKGSRIITSDDVFDFMLNLRSINDGIDRKREELFEDYLDTKYSQFTMSSMEDYEQLKKVCLARSNTQSKYIRRNLMDNVREHSNGESAFLYFTDKIKENGLYLLDEPEAALSPSRLLTLMGEMDQLVKADSQFIVATHSPILMAFPKARIYELGENGIRVVEYRETEHYLLTKRFLDDPERMLRYLLEEEG